MYDYLQFWHGFRGLGLGPCQFGVSSLCVILADFLYELGATEILYPKPYTPNPKPSRGLLFHDGIGLDNLGLNVHEDPCF